MKKAVIISLAFLLLSPVCKKNDAKDESAIAQKYARYEVSVKKNKDMKERLATLSKAEDVNLISEEIYTAPDGKKIEISKVKLADDSIGYIESKHLADSPVVFTEDTRGFIRPTMGAMSEIMIPKGTLAFIISEKGSWVQVYIGKLNNKYVKDQWVEGGYSSDKNIIIDAKDYEAATDKLTSGDEMKKSEARETLNRLAGGTNVFAGLAREKLGIPNASDKNKPETEQPDEPEGNAQSPE